MMKRFFLLAALLSAVGLAHAQHRHVHGEGQLDVAIDRDTLSLDLALPLDAAVGFERPPRNDKEKAAIAATDKALKDAAALWQPSPAANCTAQSVEVSVPFTGGDDKHGQHAHEGETHHADVEARYVFRCANPAALKSLETTLFKSFPRLYRLETQRAGPSGQGAARLTPKKPVLNW